MNRSLLSHSIINQSESENNAREKELDNLRDFHQKVVEPVRLKDFVYAMMFTPSQEWRLSQYTYMANRLLKQLKIQPSDTKNPVSRCVKLLFNVDNGLCSVQNPDTTRKSQTRNRTKTNADDVPETLEEAQRKLDEEYSQYIWKDLSIILIMYAEGNKETNNNVDGHEYPKRIKFAQDAFFFMCLHLMVDLTMWVYNADPTKNPSDPFVTNREAFLVFCRRIAKDAIQNLVNGIITDVEIFVADCIASYITTAGLNRPGIDSREYEPVVNLQKMQKTKQ